MDIPTELWRQVKEYLFHRHLWEDVYRKKFYNCLHTLPKAQSVAAFFFLQSFKGNCIVTSYECVKSFQNSIFFPTRLNNVHRFLAPPEIDEMITEMSGKGHV